LYKCQATVLLFKSVIKLNLRKPTFIQIDLEHFHLVGFICESAFSLFKFPAGRLREHFVKGSAVRSLWSWQHAT
jgi:hypothetical protein